MEWKEVLERPYRRQFLLVVNDVDRESLRSDKDGAEFLRNQSISLVNIEDNDVRSRLNLLIGGNLTSGDLLVQSPFDHLSYTDCNDAKFKFGLEKLSYITELYQFLGAREVEIIQINARDTNTHQSVSMEAKKGYVSGNLNINDTELQSLKNRMRIQVGFDGRDVDINGAMALLESRNLSSDSILSGLVRLRSNMTNPINSHHQEYILTENISKTFEILAGVKFPLVAIRSSTQKKITESLEYSLSIVAKF